MKVMTTQGPIERERLEVKDIPFETETARTVATEWRLDGELVRRSVWTDSLMPLEMGQ